MASILHPDTPGKAFDDFLRDAAPDSVGRIDWSPGDDALPVLYLSHGAPPLFDDPLWIRQLFEWAQDLPNPRAILIVSAHWEAAPLSLSSPAAAAPLVYDFGGFADRYFRMTYPTPAAHDLARRVAACLPSNEPLHQHPSRGLDHGAWVPLKVMYPHADVPVLQLSMPSHDPDRLLALGRALRPLRDEGVLIIGSGFMTHGLPFMTADMWLSNAVPTWSSEFDAWAAEALSAGDLDELADFKARAPGLPYAHPTVEHFTPLFVTLGAAGSGSDVGASAGSGARADSGPDGGVQTPISGYQFGLSKRSIQLA